MSKFAEAKIGYIKQPKRSRLAAINVHAEPQAGDWTRMPAQAINARFSQHE